MSRLPAAALAALLLLPGAVRAQAQAAPAPAPAPKDDAAATAQKPDAEVDAKTREAIQKAVQKAKEELRDEVRAEIQGAQSATEFMGAVAEGPKLQFLQLDGYLRLRGQLFNDLDLSRGIDPTGHRLFPVPLQGTGRSTLASANMRLRIEPTMNVSESVRVKAQIDVLDNYVLGSSTSTLFDRTETAYGNSFYGVSRNITGSDPTADRAAIIPRRAWAEVQTPVGLLSFGRMPSEWGLGIFTTAGRELNADFGDTIDRIQFALPPLQTPIGKLTIVPILDFDSEGVLNADTHFGPGFGQPFDAESGDDARTYAIKVARLDTDDEIRRKLERNESSFNFGAYYNYRTQRWTYPSWKINGYSGSYADTGDPSTEPTKVRRGAYVHVLDLWARLLRGRWRIEAEMVGVGGHIGEVFTYAPDPNDSTKLIATSLGRALLRQWGAVLQAEYKAIPNKVSLGAELGFASADSAPGFGVDTTRTATDANGNAILPPYGSIDGPQSGQPGDNAIRNYRFNPGYQVDLILWRELIGQVTEAWYLKPKIRWDILPGLTFDGAIIYSQMLNGSGPDATAADATTTAGAYSLARAGSKPLGAEVDGKLTLDSGNGFAAWTEVGFLQPFGGLGPGSLSRAWALGFGLAAKF